MALGKKPTAASQVEEGPDPNLVASGNPDDFIQGGLIDDFNGTIVKARYKPWDYGGKSDSGYVLGVGLTIHPDEGEGEPFEQVYSAGDLEQFVPSMNGREPVNLEVEEVTEAQEGIYALRVGKKPQMNNNTNYAHFLSALRDADVKKLVQYNADIRFLEGIRAHFNRIPQKKRPGIVQPVAAEGDRQQREKTILVITEVHSVGNEAPTKAAPGKPAPVAKPAPAAAPKAATPAAKPAVATQSASGDLDSQIVEIIAANVSSEGTAASELTQLVMKAFTGPEKAKAVKRYNDAAFRASAEERFLYDAETATFFLVE